MDPPSDVFSPSDKLQGLDFSRTSSTMIKVSYSKTPQSTVSRLGPLSQILMKFPNPPVVVSEPTCRILSSHSYQSPVSIETPLAKSLSDNCVSDISSRATKASSLSCVSSSSGMLHLNPVKKTHQFPEISAENLNKSKINTNANLSDRCMPIKKRKSSFTNFHEENVKTKRGKSKGKFSKGFKPVKSERVVTTTNKSNREQEAKEGKKRGRPRKLEDKNRGKTRWVLRLINLSDKSKEIGSKRTLRSSAVMESKEEPNQVVKSIQEQSIEPLIEKKVEKENEGDQKPSRMSLRSCKCEMLQKDVKEDNVENLKEVNHQPKIHRKFVRYQQPKEPKEISKNEGINTSNSSRQSLRIKEATKEAENTPKQRESIQYLDEPEKIAEQDEQASVIAESSKLQKRTSIRKRKVESEELKKPMPKRVRMSTRSSQKALKSELIDYSKKDEIDLKEEESVKETTMVQDDWGLTKSDKFKMETEKELIIPKTGLNLPEVIDSLITEKLESCETEKEIKSLKTDSTGEKTGMLNASEESKVKVVKNQYQKRISERNRKLVVKSESKMETTDEGLMTSSQEALKSAEVAAAGSMTTEKSEVEQSKETEKQFIHSKSADTVTTEEDRELVAKNEECKLEEVKNQPQNQTSARFRNLSTQSEEAIAKPSVTQSIQTLTEIIEGGGDNSDAPKNDFERHDNRTEDLESKALHEKLTVVENKNVITIKSQIESTVRTEEDNLSNIPKSKSPEVIVDSEISSIIKRPLKVDAGKECEITVALEKPSPDGRENSKQEQPVSEAADAQQTVVRNQNFEIPKKEKKEKTEPSKVLTRIRKPSLIAAENLALRKRKRTVIKELTDLKHETGKMDVSDLKQENRPIESKIEENLNLKDGVVQSSVDCQVVHQTEIKNDLPINQESEVVSDFATDLTKPLEGTQSEIVSVKNDATASLNHILEDKSLENKSEDGVNHVSASPKENQIPNQEKHPPTKKRKKNSESERKTEEMLSDLEESKKSSEVLSNRILEVSLTRDSKLDKCGLAYKKTRDDKTPKKSEEDQKDLLAVDLLKMCGVRAKKLIKMGTLTPLEVHERVLRHAKGGPKVKTKTMTHLEFELEDLLYEYCSKVEKCKARSKLYGLARVIKSWSQERQEAKTSEVKSPDTKSPEKVKKPQPISQNPMKIEGLGVRRSFPPLVPLPAETTEAKPARIVKIVDIFGGLDKPPKVQVRKKPEKTDQKTQQPEMSGANVKYFKQILRTTKFFSLDGTPMPAKKQTKKSSKKLPVVVNSNCLSDKSVSCKRISKKKLVLTLKSPPLNKKKSKLIVPKNPTEVSDVKKIEKCTKQLIVSLKRISEGKRPAESPISSPTKPKKPRLTHNTNMDSKVGSSETGKRLMVDLGQPLPSPLKLKGIEIKLPDGWQRTMSFGKSGRVAYTFISPDGFKLRSRSEVMKYLEGKGLPYDIKQFYPKRGKSQAVEAGDKHDPRLPPGWKRQLRTSKDGKTSRMIIISPCGRKFDSKGRLQKYLVDQNLPHDVNSFNFRINEKPSKSLKSPIQAVAIEEEQSQLTDKQALEFYKSVNEKKIEEIPNVEDFLRPLSLFEEIQGILMTLDMTSARDERKFGATPKKSVDRDEINSLSHWIRSLSAVRGDFFPFEETAADVLAFSCETFIQKLVEKMGANVTYSNLSEIVDKSAELHIFKKIIPKKILFEQFKKML